MEPPWLERPEAEFRGAGLCPASMGSPARGRSQLVPACAGLAKGIRLVGRLDSKRPGLERRQEGRVPRQNPELTLAPGRDNLVHVIGEHEPLGGHDVIDGDGALAQHRAGVHAGVHLHERHSRLGLAADDRPLDRRRTAILRQQRGVDVDRAARGHIQHGLGQDLAERDDHREVGAVRGEALGPAASNKGSILGNRT